jgi:hypothetical protein
MNTITNVHGKYKAYNGLIINLSNIGKILSLFSPQNNYGANSTVSYNSIYFLGLSDITLKFPVIKQIYPDDYIIIKITIPKTSTFTNNNLFNFSPYIFEYTDNNKTSNIFATTDDTIQFFDKIQKVGNVYTICITGSKKIAKYYKQQDCIISKLPVDLLNKITFTMLFRLGLLNDSFDFANLNNFIECTYYRSSVLRTETDSSNYYTSHYISKQIDLPTLPRISSDVLKQFHTIRDTIFNSHTNYTSYKYLSYFFNTSYAFTNAYQAVSVNPNALMQANNTGESYFNTDKIKLSDKVKQFIYVLSLNQNKLGVALTSNVQIYNTATLSAIPNGTIFSSPDLESMSDPQYPKVVNDFTLVNIAEIDVSSLYKKGIEEILIVERICYDPITYKNISYDYPGKFIVSIGNKLSLKRLKKFSKLITFEQIS